MHEIIEKMAPISMRAYLITESDSTTSAKSWEAPRPTELTALIVDDDLLDWSVWLCWVVMGLSYGRGRNGKRFPLPVLGYTCRAVDEAVVEL